MFLIIEPSSTYLDAGVEGMAGELAVRQEDTAE
jgi:hypothetical protein